MTLNPQDVLTEHKVIIGYSKEIKVIMDYEKLCEEVLNLNSKIRFTVVLNSRGDLVTNKSKGEPLLSQDEANMSVHYTFERWNRFQNLEHKLGKEKSAIYEYENVTLISLILENSLFLLSTEPNAEYPKIISETNSVIATHLQGS